LRAGIGLDPDLPWEILQAVAGEGSAALPRVLGGRVNEAVRKKVTAGPKLWAGR